MDFKLTAEQNEYRKEVMRLAEESLNSEEFLESFSYDMWNKVAEFGLFGITIPEEDGGLGESYQTAALIFEALGYACKNNGFIFAINNHIWVSQNIIYLYGSEELKKQYIPYMISGEKIGSIAMTEAEAGSDVLNMSTTALDDGDHYILNGSKMFISNGPISDVFIVFAVTQSEPVKKLTAFVVERSFKGVKTGSDIEKMGLKACPTSDLILDKCYVPKKNILGRLNQGSNIMTSALEWERCYEFVPYIGAMQRIMEQCLIQASSRKQFGKTIDSYQAVSHKIAQMQSAIELSRQLFYKIAWLKDNNRTAFLETSILKLFVSENYIQTCRDAMQIFGAYGYSKEYGIERELRDALASSIHSGTNEMQKNTIYKMLNTHYF